MMKIFTALAAAGVLAGASVVAPAPARAGDGAEIAAGVVGGLAAGAIIGSTFAPQYYSYGYEPGYYAYGYAPGPVYYNAPVYRRCHMVRERVWTDVGPRWRRVRVCN